jgi:hypothetical protein
MRAGKGKVEEGGPTPPNCPYQFGPRAAQYLRGVSNEEARDSVARNRRCLMIRNDDEMKQWRLGEAERELREIATGALSETHARTAELRRVLERTCRRLEAALALAREIRRVHL